MLRVFHHFPLERIMYYVRNARQLSREEKQVWRNVVARLRRMASTVRPMLTALRARS